MTSYVTPKKNSAFIFYVALTSRGSRPQFQANPTLAAGDVKVSIDGGTLNNLATLPDVDPNSGVPVKVSLSSDEMNGDNIQVVFIDAAGTEWDDLFISIQTSAGQIDDLATAATLALVHTDVDAILTDTGTTLDGKLDTIDANVDSVLTDTGTTLDTNISAILADTGTDGVVVASGSKTGYALSSTGIDSVIDEVTEGTMTLRQAVNIMLAALAGKSAGGGTTSITFQDNADSKARITATVDSNGNRTAVTLDGA